MDAEERGEWKRERMTLPHVLLIVERETLPVSGTGGEACTLAAACLCSAEDGGIELLTHPFRLLRREHL